MIMHNPPHPGEVLKEEFMIPLCLNVNTFANSINTSHLEILGVLNGEERVSEDLAIKLSKELDTSVDLWIGLQRDFDLSQDSK